MSCEGCKGVARAAGNAAKGLVGLTMSVLGPHASVEVQEERADTCDGCEHKLWFFGKAFCGHPIWGDADGGCGCYLVAKRRRREKTCRKWKR